MNKLDDTVKDIRKYLASKSLVQLLTFFINDKSLETWLLLHKKIYCFVQQQTISP